jgi:excinuclease ABC subunit A
VRGASEHNLKSIDVDIPLDMLVCITGVSGSGKSTLVHECIYAGLKKQRGDWQGHVGAYQKIDGGQYIDEVILVDQSPIGRTPRSNPVTYIKVYDAIRETFASTREAQARGLEPSHFSFQRAGRPLRSLSGRWHGHCRDAVSRRRRTGLRRSARARASSNRFLTFVIAGRTFIKS